MEFGVRSLEFGKVSGFFNNFHRGLLMGYNGFIDVGEAAAHRPANSTPTSVQAQIPSSEINFLQTLFCEANASRMSHFVTTDFNG